VSISIAVVSARFHVVGLGQSLRLSFYDRFNCLASADVDNGTEALYFCLFTADWIRSGIFTPVQPLMSSTLHCLVARGSSLCFLWSIKVRVLSPPTQWAKNCSLCRLSLIY